MRRTNLGERPTTRKERAAWYEAALEAQSLSGLSVSDYAERIGVTATTLYWWRRRLGQGVGAREPVKMVEVAVTGSEFRGEALVVRLGDGRRSIEVRRGFDGDDLRRLVAALESC